MVGQGNDQAFDGGFWDTNVRVSEGLVGCLRKCTTVNMDNQTSAVALWDGVSLSFLAGRPGLVFFLIGS